MSVSGGGGISPSIWVFVGISVVFVFVIISVRACVRVRVCVVNVLVLLRGWSMQKYVCERTRASYWTRHLTPRRFPLTGHPRSTSVSARLAFRCAAEEGGELCGVGPCLQLQNEETALS